MVISIMALLAALAVPAIKNFGKAEAQASAVRQLLDDVARARQLAISQRTTVFMVFLPTGFWSNAPYAGNQAAWSALVSRGGEELEKGKRLFEKQLNSYAFVTLRSVGDQPGVSSVRYVGPWHSLPEGNFIAPWKFNLLRSQQLPVKDPPPPATPTERTFYVAGFSVTNGIPFPSAEGLTTFTLPYVAFNSLGQLASEQDEYIPLARGVLAHALDVNKTARQSPPDVRENPPGNSTNTFNLIHIDWLTGRAKVISPEVR